jgi:hypothetical protein
LIYLLILFGFKYSLLSPVGLKDFLMLVLMAYFLYLKIKLEYFLIKKLAPILVKILKNLSIQIIMNLKKKKMTLNMMILVVEIALTKTIIKMIIKNS